MDEEAGPSGPELLNLLDLPNDEPFDQKFDASEAKGWHEMTPPADLDGPMNLINMLLNNGDNSLDASGSSTSASGSGLKKHRCSVCGKAFQRSSDLVRHNRIHTGEKPFNCEICGRAFGEKNHLRDHVSTHNQAQPQHACTICGRTYSHKKNLLSHQRRHNGQAFRCFEKDCDFVGASLSHLLLHQAVHSDDRPFPCDQCDAKFKYEKDLKRHRLQVHEMVLNDAGEYQCSECDLKYKHKRSLDKHRKSVHIPKIKV